MDDSEMTANAAWMLYAMLVASLATTGGAMSTPLRAAHYVQGLFEARIKACYPKRLAIYGTL